MPRGHIDMRFRRLRSPRSGRLHCNTHGHAQLHNCMGYGRTGFCLDFPFEVLSFSDLCSSRQSILFVRTICCIWISKHYDLISANVASGRWAEGRENDDHWTTLRRLVDGRGKCFAVGRPDYGEVMAALLNRRHVSIQQANAAHSSCPGHYKWKRDGADEDPSFGRATTMRHKTTMLRTARPK